MNQEKINIQLSFDKNLAAAESTTTRILEIRLTAPRAPETDKRPDLNLALVIDRSGSMQGEKLEYVKQAAAHVLDQLQSQDQAALVTYDDAVQLLSCSLPVTNGNRFELKQLVSHIRSGNSTNLRDGWLAGCKEIASAARENTINRTLLLTDGLANVGETDPEILAQHAFALQKDSISTSTFGVGYGFNEHLLEAMSNRGGGNFYFIEDPADISRIFLQEFDQLVGISVRKVEIKLDLPIRMDYKVLGDWSTEYKDGSLHINVGDMLSAKTQDIYVRLQVPAGEASQNLEFTAKVFGQGKLEQVIEHQASTGLRYADGKEVQAAPEDCALMERYSQVELAESASEALKLERRGERERASQVMTDSLNRSSPYIAMQHQVKYRDLSNRMRQGMDEADRKRSHQDSYNIKREKEKKED